MPAKAEKQRRKYSGEERASGRGFLQPLPPHLINP